MRRVEKRVSSVVLAAVALFAWCAVGASVAEAAGDGVRVLYMGDTNAAHEVAKAIGERAGRRVDLRVRALEDFERGYRSWNAGKELADLVAFRPDYLVVATGGSVPNLEKGVDIRSFREAFSRLLGCFLSGGERPRAVVRGLFSDSGIRDEQMHRAAQSLGIPFVRADSVVAALFPSGEDARFPSTALPEGVNFAGLPTQRNFGILSDDFDVRVDGRVCDVRAIRVSAHPFNRVWPGHQRPYEQTEGSGYVAFEKNGASSFSVRPRGGCKTVVVRPLSAGVRPEIENGTVSFVLPRPGHYTVEFDGSHRTLHVFQEPKRDFAEQGTPTRAFGPGVHMAGVIRVRSGDRIYVDRDAIVYGRVLGEDVRDVRIFGGGVIDGSTCGRVFDSGYTPLQPYGVAFFRSREIRVDGPILLNCAYWCTAFFDCEDVEVSNLKVVGQWRYNTDGIDVCNSRRVRIHDCFVRSFDDTICVKGVLPFSGRPVEDVSVERCVLWCGWGNTCEIGVETHAPHMKGIRFSQCDLIHNAAIVLDVGCGGQTFIDDVSYRDIRVEFQKDTEPMVLQKRDGEVWNPGGRRGTPSLAIIRANPYGKDGGGGKVGRVTYDGLKLYVEDGVPKPFVRIAAGSEVLIPKIDGTIKVESKTRVRHSDPKSGRDLRVETVGLQ